MDFSNPRAFMTFYFVLAALTALFLGSMHGDAPEARAAAAD